VPIGVDDQRPVALRHDEVLCRGGVRCQAGRALYRPVPRAEGLRPAREGAGHAARWIKVGRCSPAEGASGRGPRRAVLRAFTSKKTFKGHEHFIHLAARFSGNFFGSGASTCGEWASPRCGLVAPRRTE
jgi:hypothetical protein